MRTYKNDIDNVLASVNSFSRDINFAIKQLTKNHPERTKDYNNKRKEIVKELENIYNSIGKLSAMSIGINTAQTLDEFRKERKEK